MISVTSHSYFTAISSCRECRVIAKQRLSRRKVMSTSLKPAFQSKQGPTYFIFKMCDSIEIKVKDEEENSECKVANGGPDVVRLEDDGSDSICGSESAVAEVMIKIEPLDSCNNSLLSCNSGPVDSVQGIETIKEEGIDFEDCSNLSVSGFGGSCSADSGSDDDDAKDEEKEKQGKPDESENNETKLLKCEVCDYRTDHKGHLKRHTVARHSIEKPFPCPYCEHRCSWKKGLQEHIMSRHTGERRYHCDQCPHKSVRKQDLQQHIASVHSNLRKFQCDFCDYSCNNRNTMDTHTRARHSSEKPHSCPHCGYKSAWKKGMEQHIISKHTGEKPFQCSECLLRFTKKQGLKRHVSVKHKEEKNYLCPYCKYSCLERWDLNKHVRRMHSCVEVSQDLREAFGIPASPTRISDVSDVAGSGDV